MDAGRYKHVLFCTDISKQSDAAFLYAVDAAGRHAGARLTLLHVFQEPDAQFWRTYMPEVPDEPEALIDEAKTALLKRYQPQVPAGIPFQTRVVIGEPVQTILTFVKEKEVDLLVMGRGRRGVLTNWLLGNIMTRVATKADCPVLIVPVEE